MIVIWMVLILIKVIILITFIETLIWWYFWHKTSKLVLNPQGKWKNAVIFLTGISDYTYFSLESEQKEFLQNLGKKFDADLIIYKPFPYEQLTAKKMINFTIWQYLGLKKLPLLIISLHNFWQTLLVILVEKFYGNTVAHCIINRIGFSSSSDPTLFFVCGSIGASIALAAAPKLKEKLPVKLIIISYGGFFRNSMAFEYINHFYHLIGKKDNWAKLAQIIFPGRYLSLEPLAKAIKDKRFSIHYTGNHQHLEYLSTEFCATEAKTYQKMTFDIISKLPIGKEKQ